MKHDRIETREELSWSDRVILEGIHPSAPAAIKNFWYKAKTAGPDECWVWHGMRDRYGYGRVSIPMPNRDGKTRILVGAHRVSQMLNSGEPIPPGMIVLHSCDNPPCVNPAHLRVGTHLDNAADKFSRGREVPAPTHCPRGHPYTDENTTLKVRHDRAKPRVSRACRECGRERTRAISARNSSAVQNAKTLLAALEWLARDADQWSGQVEPPLPALANAWAVIDSIKGDVR